MHHHPNFESQFAAPQYTHHQQQQQMFTSQQQQQQLPLAVGHHLFASQPQPQQLHSLQHPHHHHHHHQHRHFLQHASHHHHPFVMQPQQPALYASNNFAHSEQHQHTHAHLPPYVANAPMPYYSFADGMNNNSLHVSSAIEFAGSGATVHDHINASSHSLFPQQSQPLNSWQQLTQHHHDEMHPQQQNNFLQMMMMPHQKQQQPQRPLDDGQNQLLLQQLYNPDHDTVMMASHHDGDDHQQHEEFGFETFDLLHGGTNIRNDGEEQQQQPQQQQEQLGLRTPGVGRKQNGVDNGVDDDENDHRERQLLLLPTPIPYGSAVDDASTIGLLSGTTSSRRNRNGDGVGGSSRNRSNNLNININSGLLGSANNNHNNNINVSALKTPAAALQQYNSIYGQRQQTNKSNSALALSGTGADGRFTITTTGGGGGSARSLQTHPASTAQQILLAAPAPVSVVAAVIDNRVGDVGVALMPIGTMKMVLAQFSDAASYSQTLAHLQANRASEVVLAHTVVGGRLCKALQDAFRQAEQDDAEEAEAEMMLNSATAAGAGAGGGGGGRGTGRKQPVFLASIHRKFFNETRGAKRISFLQCSLLSSVSNINNGNPNVSTSSATRRNENSNNMNKNNHAKCGANNIIPPANSELSELTSDTYLALAAANALLEYVESSLQIVFFPRTMQVLFSGASGCVSIDRATARALRLFPSANSASRRRSGGDGGGGAERISTIAAAAASGGGASGGAVSFSASSRVIVSEAAFATRLDHATTLCGKRLLRSTVLQPPNDEATIRLRQDTVAFLALHMDAALMPIRRAFLPAPAGGGRNNNNNNVHHHFQPRLDDHDDSEDRAAQSEHDAGIEDEFATAAFISQLSTRQQKTSNNRNKQQLHGTDPAFFPNASLAQHDLEVLLGVFMMSDRLSAGSGGADIYPQQQQQQQRLRLLQLKIGAMLNLRSALAGVQRLVTAVESVVVGAASAVAQQQSTADFSSSSAAESVFDVASTPLLVQLLKALRRADVADICCFLDQFLDPVTAADYGTTTSTSTTSGGGVAMQKLRLAYAFRDLDGEEARRQYQEQLQQQHQQQQLHQHHEREQQHSHHQVAAAAAAAEGGPDEAVIVTPLHVLRDRINNIINKMLDHCETLRSRHNVGSLRMQNDVRRGFHFVADAAEVSSAANRNSNNMNNNSNTNNSSGSATGGGGAGAGKGRGGNNNNNNNNNNAAPAAASGLPREVFFAVHQAGAKVTCTTAEMVCLNQEVEVAFAEVILLQESMLSGLLSYVRQVMGRLHSVADAASLLDMLCSLAIHASTSMLRGGVAAFSSSSTTTTHHNNNTTSSNDINHHNEDDDGAAIMRTPISPETKVLQDRLQRFGVVIPHFSSVQHQTLILKDFRSIAVVTSNIGGMHEEENRRGSAVLHDLRQAAAAASSSSSSSTHPQNPRNGKITLFHDANSSNSNNKNTVLQQQQQQQQQQQVFRASATPSTRSFRLGVQVRVEPPAETAALEAAEEGMPETEMRNNNNNNNLDAAQFQKQPPSSSCLLQTQTAAVISGPNASGKSTLLRDVAHLCILAHMGGLIPAHRSSVIPFLDAIYFRDSAEHTSTLLSSQALANNNSSNSNSVNGNGGRLLCSGAAPSRFTRDMRETGRILRAATRRSLVLLDEVGRGTSSREGAAVAGAVMAFLADKRCLTLMATHHVRLAQQLPARFGNVCALQMEVELVVKKKKNNNNNRHAVQSGTINGLGQSNNNNNNSTMLDLVPPFAAAADLVAKYGVVSGGCTVENYGILLAQTARMPCGVIDEALAIHRARNSSGNTAQHADAM